MTSLRIQKHRQGRYNSYKASLYACLASLLTCYSAMVASEPTSRSLNTWQVPFDYTSALIHVPYREITSSEKPWHLCALYPHLKDPYWLSVNYGMVSESERLDVNLTVFEAGGYPQVGNQLKQIQQCVDNNADAIVLGAVSFASLESSLVKIAQHTPIIAAVNDISDPGISAKVGVSWYSMGKRVGDYLADRHPKGSPKVDIAWFPGPHGEPRWPTVVSTFLAYAGAIQAKKFSVTSCKKFCPSIKILTILSVPHLPQMPPSVNY